MFQNHTLVGQNAKGVKRVEDAKEANAFTWTEEVAKSTKLAVVYFWHEQCPWCLRLNPIFSEVVEEYKGRIKFVKLSVLEDPNRRQIANNYGVMSTTLLFLCQGKPVGQIVGLVSKEDLERGLDDILGRYQQCLGQSTELRPAYVV